MLDRLIVTLEGAQRDPLALERIRREFPTVTLASSDVQDADCRLDIDSWCTGSFDFWAFDRTLDGLAGRPFTLCLVGKHRDILAVALEVLTRTQRLLGRRNRHSEGDWFERLLEHHRDLHPLDKPLVRADYDHALDVWQWTLRLDADASAAVQIAALYHDVERLQSEADARIEGGVPDYQSFKDAHAHEGAALLEEHLRALEVDATIRRCAVSLVASHERSSDVCHHQLLADADALSFFSLNSPGFLDYFGKKHSRRKVLYTLRRMSPVASERLRFVRLRADVAALVASAREELGR